MELATGPRSISCKRRARLHVSLCDEPFRSLMIMKIPIRKEGELHLHKIMAPEERPYIWSQHPQQAIFQISFGTKFIASLHCSVVMFGTSIRP